MSMMMVLISNQRIGTPLYGIILYSPVIAETVGDYLFIILVFAKLLFLLVKPYIKAAIAFFKPIDVEVVYQDFEEDCSE